jgi:hypothetical protein
MIGAGPLATNGEDAFYDLPVSGSSPFRLVDPDLREYSRQILPNVSLSDSMLTWMVKPSNEHISGKLLKIHRFGNASFPFVIEQPKGVYRRVGDEGIALQPGSGFRILVGDTTPPRLIPSAFFHRPAILKAGVLPKMEWQAEDGFAVLKNEIEMSLDGGVTYQPVQPESSLLTATNNSHDVVFRLRSSDISGNETIFTTLDFYTRTPDSLNAVINPGWQMLSIPLAGAFDGVLAAGISGPWAGYRYSGGGYVSAGYAPSGEAFWVGALSGTQVSFRGDVFVETQIRSVQPGWNMIGNPLVRPVAIDSLRIRRGNATLTYEAARALGWITEIYRYGPSGYQSASQLEPWKGQWVGVLTDSVIVEYPVHRLRGGLLQLKSEQPNVAGWQLRLSARVGQSAELLTIGQQFGATDGFDAGIDKPKPPAKPEKFTVDVHLSNETLLPLLGSRFFADIRAEKSRGAEDLWQIRGLSSTEPIVFKFSGNLPDSIALSYRIDAGEWQPVPLADSLVVTGGSLLVLRASVGQAVNTSQIARPESYLLRQNYPNPFNPVTTISFQLKESGVVKLEVLNMLGQRVALLCDKTYPAGVHHVAFDAKHLSTGMYFYRIRVNEFQSIKKMTLIK